jgi:hypothetical protein
MNRWLQSVIGATAAGLAVSTGGCLVAADLLNTAFLTSLGLDAQTIRPPSGTVIATFTNNTQFVAVFAAFESIDASDLSVNTRNFTIEVEPGETKNEVLYCPIQVFSLGFVDDAFAITPTGALVFTGQQGVEVDYAGAPLVSGLDFSCGDLIDVTLNPIGAGGEQANFAFTIRVRPGL